MKKTVFFFSQGMRLTLIVFLKGWDWPYSCFSRDGIDLINFFKGLTLFMFFKEWDWPYLCFSCDGIDLIHAVIEKKAKEGMKFFQVSQRHCVVHYFFFYAFLCFFVFFQVALLFPVFLESFFQVQRAQCAVHPLLLIPSLFFTMFSLFIIFCSFCSVCSSVNFFFYF